MSKLLNNTIKLIFLTLFALLGLSTISKAASFDAKISSTNVKVDGTFTVTVYANNAAGMYDVSASNSYVTVVSGDTHEFLENGSTTVTFKAVKAGNVTIIAKATDMTDSDNDELEVKGSKTFNVTITENSSNTGGNTGGSNNNNNGGTTNNNSSTTTKATITKLQVGSKSYKNPKKDLTITFDNDVSSAKISATTSNGESYKVSGSNVSDSTAKLEVGTNKVTITLASGNVYTLRIQRLPKEEEVKPNVIDETQEPEEALALTSLKIGEYTLAPEFSKDVLEYTLSEQIPNDITELLVEAVANKEEAKIEVTGNTELVEGENTIVVTVTLGEETVKYQIKVNKEQAAIMPIQMTLDTQTTETTVAPRWNTTQKILITLFTSIIAIMGICYAVIEYRYTKNKEYDDEDDDDEYYEENDFDVNTDYMENDTTNDTTDDTQKGKGKHF